MTLPRSFYARPTVEVAHGLLGKWIVHGETAGCIVEVEAYLGEGDPAAHSAAGITPRTRVIFGHPGHAYVYLSYGMHECLNIVAEPEGVAGCVLIRALEPVRGVEIMRARRPAARRDRELMSGPGRLTKALAITREHFGADLTRGDFVVKEPPVKESFRIEVSRRIGITKAADLPLRFSIRGSEFISR